MKIFMMPHFKVGAMDWRSSKANAFDSSGLADVRFQGVKSEVLKCFLCGEFQLF